MKKFCRQCQRDVRLADFYRQPRASDGLMHICKACHRTNVRKNRAANIEHYREYERGRSNLPHRLAARESYAQTPKGKAAHSKAHQAFKRRNPVKRAAQVAVGNAIRDGRLTRQPCEGCGNDKAHAHHDDYSKPLSVRWLCTKHHAEWHRHNTPKCPTQPSADIAATAT